MADLYVIDCSVASKWIIPEGNCEPALDLLRRYAAREVALIAPDLIFMEFAILLVRRQRRKQLTPEQVRSARRLFEHLLSHLSGTRWLIEPALELSLQLQLSFWDCVYLALAREHRCGVLTADARFYRGASGLYPEIELLR